MQDSIYREEYTREQARIDARKNALPATKKPSQYQRYLFPLALTGLLGYAFYTLGEFAGLSPVIFLHVDFLISAGILTAIFIWARFS